MEAAEAEVRPLLALRGRGEGICAHHVMVAAELDGWAWDVIVCEDCEAATQVERDTD